MDSDIRTEIRKGLIESYKPKTHQGLKCSVCGSEGKYLALHVLEKSINEGDGYPVDFVPMSSSRGRVRGSFPVCVSCAPQCKKCHLPTLTEKVLEFGHLNAAHTGQGVCQHIQWGLFLTALIKKSLKIGRFSKKDTGIRTNLTDTEIRKILEDRYVLKDPGPPAPTKLAQAGENIRKHLEEKGFKVTQAEKQSNSHMTATFVSKRPSKTDFEEK